MSRSTAGGAPRSPRSSWWVLELTKLIELKLASGLTAPHRLKELTDARELILRLRLPIELGEELDESVRAEYRRLWTAADAGRGAETEG